jgi:nitrous oxidase accessory protein NosD
LKKSILASCIILIFILSALFPITLGDDVNTSTQRYNGNILYVGGTGPGNYTKIQDALNDANDSFTIFVYSGTYHEDIVIKKSVKLIGQDRYNTIIDGTDHAIVVLIQADNVIFQDFTVQYPNVDECTGIFIEGSYAGIYNNLIQRTITGIVSYASDSTKIIGNVIAKNVLGVKLQGSFLNLIEGNNFIENIMHAKFQQSMFNVWDSNYWDKGRIGSFKIIFGSIGFNIDFPWIQFDRHSAIAPYDI